MMTTRVLVNDGAGFSGSYLVDWLADDTEWEIVVLDNCAGAGCSFSPAIWKIR